MPIGTVTVAWKLTTDVAGTTPATGKVRWHLPRVLLTDQAIAGLAPTPWTDLVNGSGTITIPDPWDPAIAPQGWTPEVEVESTAFNARYPVAIPAGSAGKTLDLHTLTRPSETARGELFALANHTHADIIISSSSGVTSVNGETGLVTLTAADVGAVQPGQLATVATSGAYADLTGKPSIPDSYDDLTGTVPSSALPAIAITDYLGAAANQAAMLALVGQRGDWCTRVDLGTTWIITGTDPTQLSSWTALSYPAAPVVSVNGLTGPVTLAKGDIGLGNVANLSPANLPISNATQTALDAKADAGETLKAFSTTGMVTGTFGPAGDSGTWTLCPAQYRVTVAASIGDRLLWTPGFLHQSDQEAMFDLASVVDGVAARYRSSGTNAPATAGYGGLYTAATLGRGMRAVWWTVTAEDLDDGTVTLALAYRDSGSGNVMGHGSVAGDIVLTNAGQGAA